MPNNKSSHSGTPSDKPKIGSPDERINSSDRIAGDNDSNIEVKIDDSQYQTDNCDGGKNENCSDTRVTKVLEDEDFPEAYSDRDKEIIKKIASDDNLSEAKSHASILVEHVIDAKKISNRSLGSLFTSAFTAGLEIGISLLMILSALALLSEVLPSHYAIALASLLYPLGFIIVVIGQSLLFTEQTSVLSLLVLNKLEPLSKLFRLWGIVIAGNIAGGCLFVALMIGLGIRMQLFSSADIDAYAQHVLGFEWWVIFGSSVLAGWLMGVVTWLVTSARDTLSRILLVSLITGSIGFLGLHHSIMGNIEVFAAVMYGNTVSLFSYLWFLVVTLVGNTIGGVVFVSMLKNQTFLFDVKKAKQQADDDEKVKRARMNTRQR